MGNHFFGKTGSTYINAFARRKFKCFFLFSRFYLLSYLYNRASGKKRNQHFAFGIVSNEKWENINSDYSITVQPLFFFAIALCVVHFYILDLNLI